jgi:uncharacterized protein YkwD
MKTKLTLLRITLLATMLLLAEGTLPARARPLQIVSAPEIIQTVNGLRRSQGLEPYTVDNGLMDYAKDHAEYMAGINNATHQHRDGSTAESQGLKENIAMGADDGSFTSELIVYSIWSDATHMRPMTGYYTGTIGAGVVSNGTNVFVSLVIRPTSAPLAATPGTGGSSGTGSTGSGTAAPPITALQTATPQADGSVVHTVGYGESLWQIAIDYGVTIAEIRALNGLAADSNTIFEGQKLIIFPAGSVSVQAADTPTAEAQASPTAEPTATRQPPTLTPTTVELATATAMAAPEQEEPANQAGLSDWVSQNGRTLLIGGLLLAAGALFVVFLLSFRK